MKVALIKLKDFLSKAYFWQRLLALTVSLFLFALFVRISSDFLSTLFFFISFAIGVWLVFALFKKKASQTLGKKPVKPFWVRLVAMVTLVPALATLSPALGFGVGLAINPYTAEEVAANEAREAAEKVEREAREAAEKVEREAREASEQLAREEQEKLDEAEGKARAQEESRKKEEQRLANICSSAEVKDAMGFQRDWESYTPTNPAHGKKYWFGWGFETAEILLYPQCFERALVLGYEEHWEMEANWDQDPNYIYEAFGDQRKP